MAVGVAARATSGVRRGEAMIGVRGTKGRRLEPALEELPLANGKEELGEEWRGREMLSGISGIPSGVRRSSSVGRRGSTFMEADMMAMSGVADSGRGPSREGVRDAAWRRADVEGEMKGRGKSGLLRKEEGWRKCSRHGLGLSILRVSGRRFVYTRRE